MKTERTTLLSALPVSIAALKLHARIDHADEDAALDLMIRTSANEIEAHSNVALLSQLVTVTLEEWSDKIDLPIGPLFVGGLNANPVTVQARDAAGNLSTVSGWWITGQRYPVLTLTQDVQAAALVVTYPAGYGTAGTAIPADLQLALLDQATALYSIRGGDDAPQGMSNASARIAHRNRQVRL